MANRTEQLGIKITADANGVNAEIEKVITKVKRMGDAGRSSSNSLRTMGSAATVAAQALGTLGVAISVRGMYETIASFEKLNASLKTVTGSAKTASDAMTMIRQFAAETPYDVQQVTEAFIRLRSLGLDATTESLRSYGNTAAAMGKPMMQFIEAVADATTNEFERLKEFGIKAKQEGDQVTLTFRGVSTTIQKDASEIEKYLKRIGEVEFSGGMAEQMNTMEGALSNLKDAFANFVDYIGNLGISRLIRQDFQVAAEILDTFTKSLNATFGTGLQSQIDAMTVSVRSLKDEIADMQAVKGTLWDRIFGTSADLEKRKAELADMQARLTGLQAQQRTMTGNVGAAATPGVGAREVTGAGGNSRIISTASARLGQSERNPGDLVKFMNEHSGTVFRNLTVPWCARYVSAVLNSSGVGGLKTARARDYLGFGQSVWTPNMGAAGLSRAQPGDIAVFARGKGMGHVGFIKSADPRTGRMQILGGNQGDAVSVSTRGTAGLLGIRRATGKTSDFESAETFARKEKAASEQAYKRQQEDRKRAAEEYKKQQQDAYQLFADRLDRQARLTDASLQVDASKQKMALEKLGNEYDDWERKNQLQIEVAFDQKSYEDQIRLINEAQAKSEQYIRGMNRLSGGDDSAAVKSLEKELALIDEKIAKVKATTRDETEIEKLKDERSQKTKEREKALIESQSGNLELQRALAENAAKYDGMREEAGKRIIELQNQQAEQAQKVGGLTSEAAKEIIDSQTEQLRSQVQINAAQREAELNNRTDLTTIEKQREAIKGRLVDTIAVVEAEKRAAQEKLAIDQGMLAYEEEILRVRLAGTKNIQDRMQIEAQLAENTLKQAAARKAAADIEVAAAGKIAKAQADASNDDRNLVNQNVQEQQLRLNAWWDQYMGRLRDYATLWEQITGNTSDGWAQMSLALGEYQKQFSQIQQYWQSDAAKSWGDLAPMVEVIQQAEAALAGMAKTLIAMRSNYAEGSQGYKDMTSAAERLMEVQRVMAVVEGVLGVLHQLKSGDPYTAPARAATAGAIVAMQLASIGMSSAAVPGFSNRQAQKASQAGGSTSAGGGVFGDTSAKSDSIAKSLEIVSENSSADLAYSAGMLRALTDIKYALMGTTNAVIRNVGPQSGLNLKAGMGTDIARGMLDPIGSSFAIGAKVFGDPLSKLMAKLSQFLLNTTKKITDWGLAATQQSLSDIVRGGFQGQGFTDVTTTTKVLGITVQKSTKRYFSALDSAVNTEFTRAIVGVANTVAEAGKAFGLGAKDFEDRLKGFVVNFSTISTKGLKGAELQEALSRMFSAMSDDMARAFLPGLDAFQQAGEGYLQTLVRVADGINVSTGILEQAGLKAINYQDIILKQGDVAAEIVRQSIVMFEGASSAIGAYVDQAVGSAEELMAVYQDLLIVSDTAKLAGFNLNDLSNALIVTSGGVAKFLANLQTYQTDILGSSDYARQVLTLTREFGKLGIAVPASNEAFVKLVDSIDTSTEAGQKLYAQILSLAGAFSKAQQEAQKLEELRAKYLPTDSLKGYRDQIKQVDDDFKQIIEGSLARLPGGGNYLKRTQRITSLGNRVEDRQDKLAIINEDIRELEAKGKLTAIERQRLATLRTQRKELTTEISAIQKQIADIEKLIAKNPKSKALIQERAKLIEEQGDAVLKVLADIWDSMTQSINAAKETLKSIQDSIFELAGGAGGESIKLGMANARRITAESAYNAYSGNDINKLNQLADAYYKAIMDEYQAKMDMIEAPKKALEKERELAQKAHDEQIAALEKELGVTRELFDAVKGIQDYVKNLRLSFGSTLSPKAILDQAQKQYEATLIKAQGGDVQAMRDITGASDAYLDAAKRYFGSGGKYGAIFDGITTALDKLGLTDVGDAQSIQDKIDQLNKDHEVYLKSIDDQIASLKIDEQIRALQDETAAKLQMLADDLGPRITRAEEQAKKDMQALIDEAKAGNKLNADQLTALNEMLKVWGMAPVDVPAPEPTLPAPTDSWVQDIFDKWNQGQTGYKPPMPAFASGGLAGTGWALVGEEGPELVNFGGQAMVYDAEKTKKMLRDMASFQPITSQGGKKINLETMPRVVDDIRKPNNPPAKLYTDEVVSELRALQREVKALVTTQSGANPQLINELATLNRRMETIERQQRIKA